MCSPTWREFCSSRSSCVQNALGILLALLIFIGACTCCVGVGALLDQLFPGYADIEVDGHPISAVGHALVWLGAGLVTLAMSTLIILIIIGVVAAIVNCMRTSWREAEVRAQQCEEMNEK